jgi:hypothetical protein
MTLRVAGHLLTEGRAVTDGVNVNGDQMANQTVVAREMANLDQRPQTATAPRETVQKEFDAAPGLEEVQGVVFATGPTCFEEAVISHSHC